MSYLACPLFLPKAIFPRIPHQVLIELRVQACDVHMIFLHLGFLAGDLDDAYGHFDAILGYEVSVTDPSFNRINDLIGELVDAYASFHANWQRLTFGGPWYYLENIECVNLKLITGDSYLVEVQVRVPTSIQ